VFVVSKILTFVLLPPGLFVLLLVAALALGCRKKRKPALVLAGVAAFLLYALSARVVSDLLILPLEDRYPPLASQADFVGSDSAGNDSAGNGVAGEAAKAPVVVLGGGSVDRSPEEGMRASLCPEPEKRLVYGLKVARELKRPLIFSGGRTWQGREIESEADAARTFIARYFVASGVVASGGGVSYDDLSRTTRENARFAARLSGSPSVILVTSAYHMPRAVLSFRKEGLSVLPAPTDYKANRSPYTIADFLPTSEAFANSYKALHEYLGLVGYSLAR
jgi:uncharacterized SAM-binding protein YcdF (DUF218 family)